MKNANYYLQSLPITLGTLFVARVIYCFFGAFKFANNPFNESFWSYFLSSFQSISPVFWFFGLFFLVAALGLMYQVRNIRE